MATRKEINNRRQSLYDELRFACRNGSLPLGELLPPVRELAGRYGVSHRLVQETLQRLMAEGLLYSIPRKGTFVGSLRKEREGLYLLVSPLSSIKHDQFLRLKYGFEERISRLGGTCLTLPAEALQTNKSLSAVGVYYYGQRPTANMDAVFSEHCARVYNSEDDAPVNQFRDGDISTSLLADQVCFDNEGGGYQVTHYLLGQGHRQIAFLGLHDRNQEEGAFSWSRKRMAGWNRAMSEAVSDSMNLSFLPVAFPNKIIPIEQQEQLSTQVAQRLVEPILRREITAVVTVNVHAARGLFVALEEAQLPADLWPVITTFGIGDSNVSMMTSMLVPWEQMGQEAAELLWSRSRGHYIGPPRQVPVSMRLITMLTCSPAWKMRPEAALWEHFLESQAPSPEFTAISE